jgi:hypothetical protein
MFAAICGLVAPVWSTRRRRSCWRRCRSATAADCGRSPDGDRQEPFAGIIPPVSAIVAGLVAGADAVAMRGPHVVAAFDGVAS